MQEIAFSIPVSGVARIDGNTIVITVNRAETAVSFEPAPAKEERVPLPKGKTIFDVLLETAQEFVRSNQDRFSAADLYHEALRRYPSLRRNTWTAHVIASSPNHPSQKHYAAKRDFFKYLGRGTYQLNGKYLTGDAGQ